MDSAKNEPKNSSEPAVAAPADFHHVTFRVRKVYPMSLVRDTHQSIVAMTSVKMDKETVEKLSNMANEYLKNHQEGMGPFVFTMEGEFT